ncbi:MAG: hypothetical protein U1D28_10285 [Burkholderiales bacterium]|nr:hypothetical protein [Burkholderiales bacterium]
MVNPFHTVGQAAASLVQQHLDEEQASLMAGARIASGYLVAQGKSFDELKADALVEIQVERARKEAQQRTKARLAAAEREGTQAALAEHSAKAQPAPANPDGAALTHGFDLNTVTRTQQEMLDDANDVRKLARESKMLNERYPVYRDHTALLHRTLPQAQPAPATPQQVAHLPEQAQPPRKRYRRLGWRQTPAFDHVVSTFARIAPASHKELCVALKKAATGVSPLGVKRESLFIRETGKALADKTIENAMPAIRKAAAKTPP